VSAPRAKKPPPDVAQLFGALPGPMALVAADDPVFTIVALSDAFAAAAGVPREALVGRGLLEVQRDGTAAGAVALVASLRRALTTGVEDAMPLQAFELGRPAGGSARRYWSIVNRAVPGNGDGPEFLVHRIEDLTEFVRWRRDSGEEGTPTAGAASELFLRGRQLGEARRLASQLLRTEKRLQQELELTRDLHALASRLLRIDDPRTALAELIEAVVASTGAAAGSLRIADPATGSLDLVAERGLPESLRARVERLPLAKSPLASRILSGDAIDVCDLEHSTVAAPYREWLLAAGFRSLMAAPLPGTDGRVEGILSLHFRGVRRRSDQLLRRFEIFARQAAELVRRVRARAALEASEARLGAFVDNVRDYALVQVGADGRVESWNSGAERIFGYSRDEIVGRSSDLLLDREAPPAMLDDSDGAPAMRENEEARWMRRRDGSRFWGRGFAEPIGGDAGSRGFAVVLHDETERRRHEERLAASLAEKDALLEEVHHRVKNNLQIVVSLLNLQARELQDPRSLELFAQARDRIGSIATLHDQLYHAEGESLATIDLVAYARRLVEDRIRSHRLEDRVHGEIVAAAGVRVGLERAASCALVLNELVSNALVHAYPEAATGPLRVELGVEDGAVCVVEVRDRGVGVEREPASRARPALGLDLVRVLVTRLGGSFALVSESDGTRAVVRFPLSEAEEDPSAEREAIAEAE